MATYGFDDLKIEVDATTGGDLADISAYILAINGITIERILEECTPAGAGWEVWFPTGLGKCEPIELSGAYDDTAATGPNVILNDPGATRSFAITYGGSKITSGEAIIQKFTRGVKAKELTRFTCILQPTDTISEA
jgi:hypothetical protein